MCMPLLRRLFVRHEDLKDDLPARYIRTQGRVEIAAGIPIYHPCAKTILKKNTKRSTPVPTHL